MKRDGLIVAVAFVVSLILGAIAVQTAYASPWTIDETWSMTGSGWARGGNMDRTFGYPVPGTDVVVPMKAHNYAFTFPLSVSGGMRTRSAPGAVQYLQGDIVTASSAFARVSYGWAHNTKGAAPAGRVWLPYFNSSLGMTATSVTSGAIRNLTTPFAPTYSNNFLRPHTATGAMAGSTMNLDLWTLEASVVGQSDYLIIETILSAVHRVRVYRRILGVHGTGWAEIAVTGLSGGPGTPRFSFSMNDTLAQESGTEYIQQSLFNQQGDDTYFLEVEGRMLVASSYTSDVDIVTALHNRIATESLGGPDGALPDLSTPPETPPPVVIPDWSLETSATLPGLDVGTEFGLWGEWLISKLQAIPGVVTGIGNNLFWWLSALSEWGESE